MRLADLHKRIGAIEDALANGTCHVCFGSGNSGPYGIDESIPSPVCPACGAVARRQIRIGVLRSELDALCRLALPQHATLHIWENV